MSALLHDVVEDCDVPVSEIRRLFGDTVAKTVDAVTALSDRDFGENKPSKKKRDSLSDVKLQENMTVKALYVKIADRIDNLSTISGVKEEKRMPKAKHTQEILIPMAERAKAYYYVDILEDLCFRIEHPGLVGLMEKIRDRICAENRLATGKSLLAFEKIFDHKRKSPDKMLEPYRRNIIEFRQQDRSMVSLYRQITGEMRNSNELERIKTIITSLVNGFEECAKCIDLVVNSNQTNIDDTSEVITSFSLIEDGISETNEKVARISSIVLQTMSEIHSVSEQVEKIEGSAQSTAAASQQVTATTQELAAHMNEVENDISGLAAGSHELAARLNTFEV